MYSGPEFYILHGFLSITVYAEQFDRQDYTTITYYPTIYGPQVEFVRSGIITDIYEINEIVLGPLTEEEVYQRIHDLDGFIYVIKNPTAKQTRVHQMAHVI